MSVNNTQIWHPTKLGKLCTGASDWELQLIEDKYLVITQTQNYSGHIYDFEFIKVNSGYFWSSVELPYRGKHYFNLDGIPNKSANRLLSEVLLAINKLKNAEKAKERAEANVKAFSNQLLIIEGWSAKAALKITNQLKSKGWLTKNKQIEIFQSKPFFDIDFNLQEISSYVKTLGQDQLEAISFWKADPEVLRNRYNNRQYDYAKSKHAKFFNEIESSPLTEEQIKAVVCFDHRILLVASAGSGKTSTMVAKCGYAIKQGYFESEQILLLAFNKDAADELTKRIKTRFEKHSIPHQKIVVKTFHAFGLDVIGNALGKRPSIPAWLEAAKDTEVLMRLVDELKDRDLNFRIYWDLFRLVLGQDLPKFGSERNNPDSWDRTKERKGFWTFNNEVVKSRGELMIANWLFYNGIKYQYEAPYKHDTANAKYGQYTPDFYFPDIDVYLEHWAVDANGEPPKEFVDYKAGMIWKKELHAKHGTQLLETTMAELWSGNAFTYLSQKLTEHGLKLDPNPDRKTPGRKPIENARLIRTFRSFLTHVKSNRLTIDQLKKKLDSGMLGSFKFRHQIFLMLFESILQAWDEKLAAENYIDFDDMINMATDLIVEDKWNNPYQLIMVDEFQDLSQSRTRLLNAMLSNSEQYLFGVGDDWQSINRFAGAHLGVMTNFEAEFGESTILKLENTFRCPQSLCDISSKFIQKNPNQLKKIVLSKVENVHEPLSIFRVPDESHIQSVIQKKLKAIELTIKDAAKKTVYILGRYNTDKAYVPINFNSSKLKVSFITVHSSKGIEADHVIIPKLSSENLGFPSQIEDDPILQLVMPAGDTFQFSEERRLFYVALTRARSTVTLITLEKKESPFILELVEELKLVVHDFKGHRQSLDVCPKCQNAFIAQIKGPFGLFYSCSAYPLCDFRPPRNYGNAIESSQNQENGLSNKKVP
jgi:DNA helicase IV